MHILLRSAGVALLFVVFASGGTALAQTGEPIRIGLLVPLTGGLAEFGIAAKPAVEFRLEEAGWKVAGRSIKLIVADTAAQPAMALDQGKKLVEHDKVHVVIGPFVSGPRLAVLLPPICPARRTMRLSGTSFPQLGHFSTEQG